MVKMGEETQKCVDCGKTYNESKGEFHPPESCPKSKFYQGKPAKKSEEEEI